MLFADRFEAGRRLAEALAPYSGRKDAIILAIPRGALQIGKVLHDSLGLPLDIIVTKKIPHPLSEEFAIGAVGPGGEYFVNPDAALDASPAYIEGERKRLEAAVEEKYARYRGARPRPKLMGKTVILVDDGIATGSTIIAAIHVLRKQNPAKIVVAVPVAPPDGLRRVEEQADEVVCLAAPPDFMAIGQYYSDFTQVEDEEAIRILSECSG